VLVASLVADVGQFGPESGGVECAPGGAVIVVGDENAVWKDADRALDDTEVPIGDVVVDSSVIEQRRYEADEHDIVRSQ